ncbi:tRNA-dihydrouridine synthase [Patescibacteria group bacterium]|nr:MAG: tRNA-dihydrouridine synthase [Patescibacteria group bacterium]
MVKGFWKKAKPIFVLAPMADVTDAAFRIIIAKHGKPDAMWTEFVSCDGLCSDGKAVLLKNLEFTEAERPIVAQFFGAKPDNFYQCALLAQELGFDGIDINMGCPDKKVEKQGAGASLMRDHKLAQKIIIETKRGAGDLPVSVKTRIGYNSDILDEWLPRLLETEPAAITVHARTRKEMSKVPARWEAVARAVEIAHQYDSSPNRTMIIGNGDIASLKDAEEKVMSSGADGAMIGRGIFGNPWFFNKEKSANAISIEEKLSVMIEHSFLFEKLFAGTKNFNIMKKHFKAYVSGFDGAKDLRVKLMSARDTNDAAQIVKEYFPNTIFSFLK